MTSSPMDSSPVALWAGMVRSPVASLHAEAGVASPMTSEVLAGHVVDVIGESGDWLRVRGADGYPGWMHVGFLARLPQSGAGSSRDDLRISLGCVTETAAGDRRALPLRALLVHDEILKTGEVVDESRLSERFPADPTAVARTAREYFGGTSYLWGGVTPWGADCSGCVQTVFALHGVRLPRDAHQQAEVGADAGESLAMLRAADLAFFSDRDDRRVTHVGIAVGDGRMIHVSLARGGYAVERLDDSSDQVVARLARQFVGARRVL